MALPKDVAFYTPSEIADHLRISHMTVYRAIDTGELRVVKLARAIRIPVDAAHEWMNARTGEKAPR